jgi:hypothetical protein
VDALNEIGFDWNEPPESQGEDVKEGPKKEEHQEQEQTV